MRNTILVACLLFATQLFYAQQTVDASGGDAIGSGGQASYSVGQMVYTTHTGSNGRISQGVQQSYEIFTLSNAALSTVNLTAITYPNPTSDYVVLTISDVNLTDMSYALYDLQGREVAKGLTAHANTHIGMEGHQVFTSLK